MATTFQVSLASAQWTLTITPLTGRLGAGPHRRGTILATLGIVVAGSVLTVLHLPFAWLLVGRGLTALMIGVARDHLAEERASATIALASVASTIGIGVGYPLAGLLTELGGRAGGLWARRVRHRHRLAGGPAQHARPTGGSEHQ